MLRVEGSTGMDMLLAWAWQVRGRKARRLPGLPQRTLRQMGVRTAPPQSGSSSRQGGMAASAHLPCPSLPGAEAEGGWPALGLAGPSSAARRTGEASAAGQYPPSRACGGRASAKERLPWGRWGRNVSISPAADVPDSSWPGREAALPVAPTCFALRPRQTKNAAAAMAAGQRQGLRRFSKGQDWNTTESALPPAEMGMRCGINLSGVPACEQDHSMQGAPAAPATAPTATPTVPPVLRPLAPPPLLMPTLLPLPGGGLDSWLAGGLAGSSGLGLGLGMEGGWARRRHRALLGSTSIMKKLRVAMAAGFRGSSIRGSWVGTQGSTLGAHRRLWRHASCPSRHHLPLPTVCCDLAGAVLAKDVPAEVAAGGRVERYRSMAAVSCSAGRHAPSGRASALQQAQCAICAKQPRTGSQVLIRACRGVGARVALHA